MKHFFVTFLLLFSISLTYGNCIAKPEFRLKFACNETQLSNENKAIIDVFMPCFAQAILLKNDIEILLTIIPTESEVKANPNINIERHYNVIDYIRNHHFPNDYILSALQIEYREIESNRVSCDDFGYNAFFHFSNALNLNLEFILSESCPPFLLFNEESN